MFEIEIGASLKSVASLLCEFLFPPADLAGRYSASRPVRPKSAGGTTKGGFRPPALGFPSEKMLIIGLLVVGKRGKVPLCKIAFSVLITFEAFPNA